MIEVMTDLSAGMSEGEGVTVITTDELVKRSFASLKAGALEIRPGQAKQLAFRAAFSRSLLGSRRFAFYQFVSVLLPFFHGRVFS